MSSQRVVFHKPSRCTGRITVKKVQPVSKLFISPVFKPQNRSKIIKALQTKIHFATAWTHVVVYPFQKCDDNLSQPAAASHLYPAEARLAAQPAYEKLWQSHAYIRLWSCFMGQHGPLIWDGHLYGLCFIFRNYTIRLGGRGRTERDENGCKKKKRKKAGNGVWCKRGNQKVENIE